MYNKITIDELLELNNKDINPQSAPKTEENKTKEMYYGGSRVCKQSDNEQNLIGIGLIIIIIFFIIYKLSKNLKTTKTEINFFKGVWLARSFFFVDI